MVKKASIWILGICLALLFVLDTAMLLTAIIVHFKMPFSFYCAAPIVAWSTWLIYTNSSETHPRQIR